MEFISPTPCLALKQRKPWQLLSFLALLLCLSAISPQAFAQERVLDVGIRVQKTINLYYENGFTLQYTADQLASQRLYFGLSYVSSRLALL